MIKGFVSVSLVYLFVATSCVRNPEEMSGPTMGYLDILADESTKYIIDQEEEIFERTYKHAHLNIQYVNEYDMMEAFLRDSIRAIIANRPLTAAERANCIQNQAFPRETMFATGAIAFVTNNHTNDTTYTYEDLMHRCADVNSGNVFVIENAKSGITQEILRRIRQDQLPAHFYALRTKKEVMDYLEVHNEAIGIMDYTDFSDSDSAYTQDVLRKVHLLGITRPADSTQVGYVQPFQYNLQDNIYPFTRDMYFISKTGKDDVGTGFASFICGEIGQKIILKSGLLPKFQTERLLEITRTNDINVVK